MSIDKRTKEYKRSMEKITNPDIVVEPTQKEFLDTVEAIDQSDPPEINPQYEHNKRIDNIIIEAVAKGSEEDEVAKPDIFMVPDMKGISESGKAYFDDGKPELDFSKPENNPGFSLCKGCGISLPPNDDGSPKRSRQGEHCWECVHEHANSIVCEDGVIRAKEDCKRMTRIDKRTADEVFYWVKK